MFSTVQLPFCTYNSYSTHGTHGTQARKHAWRFDKHELSVRIELLAHNLANSLAILQIYYGGFQRCSQDPCKTFTAQKMKFSMKDFLSKCDQIRRKLRIWSHLLKKSLIENFIFCAVIMKSFLLILKGFQQLTFVSKNIIATRRKKIDPFCDFFILGLDWNKLLGAGIRQS